MLSIRKRKVSRFEYCSRIADAKRGPWPAPMEMNENSRFLKFTSKKKEEKYKSRVGYCNLMSRDAFPLQCASRRMENMQRVTDKPRVEFFVLNYGIWSSSRGLESESAMKKTSNRRLRPFRGRRE